MTDRWQWQFFLADDHHDITPAGDTWSQPLPMAVRAPEPDAAAVPSVTYGQYFQAVKRFITADNGAVLRGLPTDLAPAPLTPDTVRAVQVYLVKHGAFYHPARVVVALPDGPIQLALNVAVSAIGRRMLPQEVDALNALNRRYDDRRVPRVFAHGGAETDDGRPLELFLCDWFSDYHEFHLAQREAAPDQLEVVVWDEHGGRTRLDTRQMRDVYRRAAAILTAYYDPETACAISAWHHAAGDFVAHLDEAGRVDLRLITVRQYAPILAAMDPDAAVEALTLFFIDLSLRMRLDRLDGIGDTVWAPDAAVDAAVHGFFQALEMKGAAGELPEGFARAFHAYLGRAPADDLTVLTRSVIERYDPRSDDIRLMRRHLEPHVCRLKAAIDHMDWRDAAEGPPKHHIKRYPKA